MKKKKSIIFTYFLLVVFLTIYFKFFENTYVIYRYNLDTRLVKNYGYCEKNSYGFLKYIEKKYKPNKNITVLNDEIQPNSSAFIYQPKKEYDKNMLIILNYNQASSSINMNDYAIKDRNKNCYYLTKND